MSRPRSVERRSRGACILIDRSPTDIARVANIPAMPASMPLGAAFGRSGSERPLFQRVRLDEDRDASYHKDPTRLEQFNSRRVDRGCRRRGADFFAHDPPNPHAYGTCVLTKRGNRELRPRWSAFRGIPAASRRRCAELRRNNSGAPRRCQRKVLGVGEFTAGPARCTLSGATKLIRSVMHPACSKGPPLAWQNKTYFERIIGAREARTYS